MSKTLILLLFLFFASAGLYVYSTLGHYAITSNDDPDLVNVKPNKVIKTIKGTITKIDYGCLTENVCAIFLDGRKVIFQNNAQEEVNTPRGSTTGLDLSNQLNEAIYIGSKGEVYGSKIGATYTIYGSKDFYIKVLEK